MFSLIKMYSINNLIYSKIINNLNKILIYLTKQINFSNNHYFNNSKHNNHCFNNNLNQNLYFNNNHQVQLYFSNNQCNNHYFNSNLQHNQYFNNNHQVIYSLHNHKINYFNNLINKHPIYLEIMTKGKPEEIYSQPKQSKIHLIYFNKIKFKIKNPYFH